MNYCITCFFSVNIVFFPHIRKQSLKKDVNQVKKNAEHNIFSDSHLRELFYFFYFLNEWTQPGL